MGRSAGGGDGELPQVPEKCLCGYGPLGPDEWCPRCWPGKQPQVEQLDLFALGD